jgi:potassium/hydrogen antiporter
MPILTKFLPKLLPYAFIVLVLGSSFILSRAIPGAEQAFAKFPEGLYLTIALIFIIGFSTRKFSKKVIIPSFVLAILMGLALQPLFSSLTANFTILSTVNEFLAALILFGSGVEMPWQSFKKYFGPIASLAFFGMLLSVLLFALILEFLTNAAGISIPAFSLLLVGAILAAVEPSAIIPIFKNLEFKERKIRDIAIAEGAVNDVTGTVITRFFLVMSLAATTQVDSVMGTFLPLIQRHHFNEFALEILWGVIVGIIGAKVLQMWYNPETTERDNPALFFAVPIFCFALGGLVGGSGYLAAFVAGLLYQTTTSTRNVAHFYETFNSHLVVPVIFVLLGAVIPIDALIQTAGVGIVAALLFMFVVRPVVVFASLLPWLFGENRQFNFSEYAFLSIIRETGGVSAVLLLIIAARGIPGVEYIFGIGFWVIFMTLIVEPPITPYITKKLGLAEPIKHHEHGHSHHQQKRQS